MVMRMVEALAEIYRDVTSEMKGFDMLVRIEVRKIQIKTALLSELDSRRSHLFSLAVLLYLLVCPKLST